MYSRMEQVKFFKGCLLQILFGPFLNTLSHIVNRFFQAKHSTLVHSFSSHNDVSTMIWKLQESGGQITPIKRNVLNNFF